MNSKYVTYNSAEKIWSGPKMTPVLNPQANVGHLILDALKKTPSKITQIVHETGAKMTCAEMYERTIKVCIFLQSLQLVQGDIVGIVSTNQENIAPLIFACLALGLPVNSLWSAMDWKEIKNIFDLTQPKATFCDSDIIFDVKNIIANSDSVKMITFGEKIDGFDFIEDVLSTDINVDDFV